ncbi:polysaccharide deacetylase family protein [Kineococcus rubinsiae]|uniref:polysaccharide deacetylase family protein n=1 Tax=Kineococcus rubinsiae TaxID=2609562 RepID=UPI001430143C|nr:polysaccharide deacetylase family protein [Kineococcus rubinsiae]NIZ91969.1 polysaccharide deacetylase family protein [Kineococcus rubinsiae]
MRISRRLAAAALAVPLALSMTAGSAQGGSRPGHPHPGGCRQWIALTFDDGPSSYRTQTLETLREKQVPATFFDVGVRVAANPQFAGFEAREGHLVLNHTWDHPRLTTLTAEEVRSQLARTEQVLARAGAPLPFRLVRPPFGATDPAVESAFTAEGYAFVTWDVVAVDWDVATTSEEVRDTIVQALRPGLVVLMHDGPIDSAAGAADEAALPQVIDRARAQGYCFGQLDAEGEVVRARYRGTRAPVPEVINPVPYLPLTETSRGQLPPEPYVVVDPAAQN